VSLFTKAQLDKLAEYGGATSDPLALNLVTLSHNVDNYHRDPENFSPIDPAGGVGSANPQGDSDSDNDDGGN
jgi:hypothetical protein